MSLSIKFSKLKLLRLDGYQRGCLPSNFRPENLVRLEMQGSNLERLWEGAHVLRGLKKIDLQKSIYLKEIPNLSMATNLEELNLSDCSSLVELPLSIQPLNKLKDLMMSVCSSLETLPNGINLQSLDKLHLNGCSRLDIFPNISTNVSELCLSDTSIDELPSNLHLENLDLLMMGRDKFWDKSEPLTSLMATLPHSLRMLILSEIPSLVELPSSIQNITKLDYLSITDCINLEIIPTGINLKYLDRLDLSGCSRLKTFPNISTNVDQIFLSRTGIEEVPWWIENFTKLELLIMNGCNNLQSVSLHLSKLKTLEMVDFSQCGALSEASWNDSSSALEMETDNTDSKSPDLDVVSSSFPENFIKCFNYIHIYNEPKKAGFIRYMMLSGEEVLPYFIHRTTRCCVTNIPLFHPSPLPPSFRFKACAVVDCKSTLRPCKYKFHVSFWFKSRLGNNYDWITCHSTWMFCKNELGIHLVIFECSIPLNEEDDASLTEEIYDYVDIQFHLINYNNGDYDSWSELKGWGIRLSDEFSSVENQLDYSERSQC